MPTYELFTIGEDLDPAHQCHDQNDPIRISCAHETEARLVIDSVVRNYTGLVHTSPWLDKSKTICRQVEADGFGLPLKILHPEWMEVLAAE